MNLTKNQRWLIAGVIIALSALLCCGAASFAAVSWWGSDDPSEVVEEYLGALERGDTVKAADLTCDDRQHVIGWVNSFAGVTDWEIIDETEGKRNAEVTAFVTFQVLGVTNRGKVVFTLVDEDGDWRVCGIRGPR